MDHNDIGNDKDQEYHFSDDFDPAEFGIEDEFEEQGIKTSAPKSGFGAKISAALGPLAEKLDQMGLLEKLKGMAVPIAIGAIIILFGITKLWGIFFPPESKQAPQTHPYTFSTPQKPAATNQSEHTQGIKPLPMPNIAAKPQSAAKPQKLTQQLALPGVESATKTSGSDKKVTKSAQSVTINPIKSPSVVDIPHVSQLSTATPSSSSRVSALETQIAQVNNKFAAIQKQNKAYSKQLSESYQQNQDNSQKIAEMQKSLQQLQGSLEDVNKSLLIIAKQVKSEEVAQQKKHAAAVQQKQHQAAMSYYIQAIIPGRAWLKGRSGQVLTVGVGDRVPGFGKVVRMNVQQGTVTTDENVTFQFGITD